MIFVYSMNISGNVVDVFPYIFNRPFIPVNLEMPLYQFSVFLAIGPEIYVDGLIVLDKKNQQVVGRLGSKNILFHLINKPYSEWQNITAEEIMDRRYNKEGEASAAVKEEIIGIDTPVSQVIELFQKTKLAFTPVIKNGSVVAVLTIRDFLPLVKSKDSVETTTLSKIASALTTIDKNTDVFMAIDIMLKKGIRNIGLTENEKESSRVIGVVNDRSILEFLLSHNGRQIMEDYEEKRISHIKISKSLKLYPLLEVPQNESIKIAANLLTEMERPFLILEGKDKIVTPWDIVMKTFSKIS